VAVAENGAGSDPAPVSRSPVSHPADDEATCLDLASLLARVENDSELLSEMIELFLETSPLLVAEIEAGVVRQDGQTIERAAHALKGAMQSMGAVRGARAAMRLEELGRSNNPPPAAESLAGLKHDLESVVTILSDPAIGAQA
jgi:HPt (histidine-containing phosphotransfer) domain-containing protein